MSQVEFALNGERVVLDGVDPKQTLVDYIRRFTTLTGTKIGCGEGGCGSCAVVLSKWDEASQKEVHASINSCLRPLASVDGYAVTTVEGIGSIRKGLHPVQERLARYNASQCGYCTPGFAVTMFAQLRQSEGNLDKHSIERALDGNICRCTGYRPIISACKSFGSDATANDLAQVIGANAATDIGTYNPGNEKPLVPDFLRKRSQALEATTCNGRTLLRPTSLDAALAALASPREGNVKLMVGNTSMGIYKSEEVSTYIQLSAVPELSATSVTADSLTVGAATSVTNFIQLLRANVGKSATFEALADHAQRVAGTHVRNAGSIGGNIAMANQRAFESDLATILLGHNATVTLANASGSREVSFAEFLGTPLTDLIVSVKVPFAAANQHFQSYKSAIRVANSHAFLNAAFFAGIKDGKIENPTVAYGCVGPVAVRASKTEAFLNGKAPTKETFDGAVAVLSGEVVIDANDHIGRANFRSQLVLAFLHKFLVYLQVQLGTATPELAALKQRYVPEPSYGTQDFVVDESQGPSSKPISKLGAQEQATGEVRYTDDMPLPADTLWAAYAISVKGLAKIKIDKSKAANAPGVVAVFLASDIPGKNNCVGFGPGPEILLAEDEVTWAGQPLALVVADTPAHAREAAKLVEVTYDTAGKKPITTIKEALAANSTFDIAAFTPNRVIEKGNPSETLKTCDIVVKGQAIEGSQSHFYMETQSAHASYDEEGKLIVWSGNQFPSGTQDALRSVLGMPANKILLNCRRAGGGFGGRITRCIPIACAAAMCAYLLHRHVRFVLDRETDLTITGGRHNYQVDYEVGATKEGKLQALKATAYIDGGCDQDVTFFCCMAFNQSLDQVYFVPDWNSETVALKSNLPTKTAMRGPGEIQSSHAMETMLAHVAAATGKTVHEIRELNFYADGNGNTTPYGRPINHFTHHVLWNAVKKSANFDERQAKVNEFNAANRLRKRGIAMTPVKYGVGMLQTPGLLNIYASDGSITITHGGSEIGQGIHTKVAQATCNALSAGVAGGVEMGRVTFNDTATTIVPNMQFTGGSTTSESACIALTMAANEINARLEPIKEAHRKANDGKDPTWEELIGAAARAKVNLQASALFAPDKQEEYDALYFNFGVACSEIELDVATGQVQILDCHLMYDCGKSLNPAIDLGQVEGAFLQGVGFYLNEQVLVNEDGLNITNNTWTYKPPCVFDVPQHFHVELLKDSPFAKGFLSSKASGEPPLVLASSVFFAVREAIASFRKQKGLSDYFALQSPATVDVIQQACSLEPSDLVL